MKTLPFKSSPDVSLGVELEFQIINPKTYDLISRAKDLIKNIKESPFQSQIKPEITQSMIEINSSIYLYPKEMLTELLDIQSFLLQLAKKINILICGGGTHPFEKWTIQKIFPSKRFKKISRQFKYLSKRSTVFGQHVHVGCANGEDALYLTHALARYTPQLIAMSASSPFYQSVDTGFNSSRSNVFNAFPMGGVIPYLITWEEFSTYFYKMQSLSIIESMKDFYWDIRPKPEFGTVEVRVCDTPLTIKKAIIIAAYIQTLSHYLLQEKPVKITHNLYHLYNYNRFQASRFGLEGEVVNPFTSKRITIANDILETLEILEKHASYLKNTSYLSQLTTEIENKINDSSILRALYKQLGSLPDVVHEQCYMWSNNK